MFNEKDIKQLVGLMEKTNKSGKIKFFLSCGNMLIVEFEDVEAAMKKAIKCHTDEALYGIAYEDGRRKLINMRLVTLVEAFFEKDEECVDNKFSSTFCSSGGISSGSSEKEKTNG